MRRCDDPYCARLVELERERTHITIRAATPDERHSLGAFWATGAPMRAKRWIVVEVDNPENWVGAFGLPDTATSKAEAVFWAERWASKNGAHFVRPAGWEKVVGNLPDPSTSTRHNSR